jgi:hypothetical protein
MWKGMGKEEKHNTNILKMKGKCILPTSGSAWHIQTPPQWTSTIFFWHKSKFINTTHTSLLLLFFGVAQYIHID